MDLKVSQKALIKACQQLNIPYTIIHKDKILIRVDLNPPLFFLHHKKAFDREDMISICKDKDLFYTLLKGKIEIPKWESYLDPSCNPQYRHYVRYPTIKSIVKQILQRFKLPLIVKKNRGSMGLNVFLCKNKKEIEDALQTIFNHQSKEYDYLAIAQEQIRIKCEYRIIAYKRKVLLSYEKDISGARFNGNLSPLHWENAKAVMVKDDRLIKKFKDFIQPIFDILPIKFVGLDIAIDQKGKMILIEANKTPGFSIFVRDNGIDPIVKMTKYMLKDYMREHSL